MTERAQMYGGDVVAGPRPDGGFRVRATLRTSADPVAIDGSIADRSPTTTSLPAVDAASGTRARRRPPLLAWDVALAVALAGVGVVELLDGRGTEGITGATTFTPTDGWAWFLKLSCCLLLIGRRRYPASTALAVAVLGVTLTIGDYNAGVVVAALVIALYAVGSYATTARFVGAIVGIGITMAIVAWSDPPDLTTAGAVWTAMFATAAAGAGYLVRIDRERGDATIAGHEDAGASESRRARLAVTTERLRIAEELSSVIKGSIRSISLQAGSGSQLVETDPAAALVVLESISVTSRASLADLRRLLSRMRPADEPSQYTPVTSPDSTRTGPPR